jgi:hypothetical protein
MGNKAGKSRSHEAEPGNLSGLRNHLDFQVGIPTGRDRGLSVVRCRDRRIVNHHSAE